ncbi:hypothetical protein CHS0354_019924 [Potamilus streckersoni]|uniref:Uncharacterized protein n=1 Tax=Potamilus streckersoni TaxID=2493646 RepID=A0AAE0SNP3_9BIVA|nr:hypothetical protein CHS0354_019924 [Potamilus streckersoni]
MAISHLTMPQATNVKAVRALTLCPTGPDSVHKQVANMCALNRQRALQINKVEVNRLEKLTKFIEKERKESEVIQSRIMERMTKSLQERKALHRVLVEDYRVDNFITMKKNFNPEDIDTEDRKSLRRFILESRVFNSGFGMKSLRPEVRRKLRQMDPVRKIRCFKKKLLEHNKAESNFLINPAIPDYAFYKMLSDRKHWKDYNVPKTKYEDDDGVNSDGLRAGVQDDQKETVQKDSFPEMHREEFCDRDTVLERRLSLMDRRNVVDKDVSAAPKVTMSTLGPVYFQTAVNVNVCKRQ